MRSHAALGGEWREAVVSDPLGRPVPARWLVLPDGRAVVEAAAAIGLPLLTPEERDPLVASSRGLGELVLAALRASAALRSSSDSAGARPSTAAQGFARSSASCPVPTTVLCDVRTTLADAARLFGPQKGATPRDGRRCSSGDSRRMDGARAVRRAFPAQARRAGSARHSPRSARSSSPVRPRFSTSSRFDERLAGCDLVVTGEGQVDETTAEGKAPGVVAERCASGRCTVRRLRRTRRRAASTVRRRSACQAIARTPSDLEDLGKRSARRSEAALA